MEKGAGAAGFKKIKKFILIFAMAGIAVIAALGIYADMNKAGGSMAGFNFAYLPLILALAPLNYCLRFVKWNYYLARLKIKVPRGINAAVFTAGLSMTITPAKAGEFFKSYLLKEFCGIEMSKTAPLIIMERLTDGIAMILLASAGAAVFSYGYAAIIICVAAVALFIAIVRIRPAAMFLIGLLGKVRFLKRFGAAFENLYGQTYELSGLGAMLAAIGIGVVSWFFEGVVIYFALTAFGLEFSVLASVFTVSVSSLAGAVSMLPGGLVAAEGSIMGILVLVFGVDGATASATTIITRFSTLWLGVAAGVAGMMAVQRLLKKAGKI